MTKSGVLFVEPAFQWAEMVFQFNPHITAHGKHEISISCRMGEGRYCPNILYILCIFPSESQTSHSAMCLYHCCCLNGNVFLRNTPQIVTSMKSAGFGCFILFFSLGSSLLIDRRHDKSVYSDWLVICYMWRMKQTVWYTFKLLLYMVNSSCWDFLHFCLFPSLKYSLRCLHCVIPLHAH